MDFIFNKNAELYYNSSKKLGLPAIIIDPIEGFFFQLGKKNYFFRGMETPLNNTCSENLARNKYCTNQVLESAGIPVPKAATIHIDTFKQGLLENIISNLNFPLVIKPSQGALGKDVVCNISTLAELNTHMARIFPTSEWITIEEFHGALNSFRVLILNHKIIGIVQRYAAHVVGDGQHTLTELVARANHQRRQISDELANIAFDDECHIRLQELKITPDYIPALNERVVLCYTSNASRGGSYESLKINLCKENRRLFLKIGAVLNLNIAGIDVECKDLNTPINTAHGVIIEVNPSPSIRIHEAPQSGMPNPVSKKIIRSIIYRHPLSYLHLLYKNKVTAPFFRGLIAPFMLMIIYLLFRTS